MYDVKSPLKGYTWALIVVTMHAFLNIYFKFLSAFDINPFLFITTSILFAGVSLILSGRKSSITKDAIINIHTWIYGVGFVLNLIFFFYLMKYVSATDASLLGRLNTVIAMVLVWIFIQRNTIAKSWLGLSFILAGIGVVLSQIESNLKEVIVLTLLVALARSAFYLSVELNRTGYKVKSFKEDRTFVGYVLGVTSFVMISVIAILSLCQEVFSYEISFLPKIEDFYNGTMMLHAALYGILFVSISRYMEFVSIRHIGAEMFACMVALVPFLTMIFESVFVEVFPSLYSSDYHLDTYLLLASALVIIGSVIVVVRKNIDPNLSEMSDMMRVKDEVLSDKRMYADKGKSL